MATATVTTVDISRALKTPDLRWPFPAELQWLAEQAQTHELIVDWGSYLGRSSCAMAANTSGVVWAVDDFYGPRDSDLTDDDRKDLAARFYENVTGLPVNVICTNHAEVSNLPVEWIRGSESEKPDMVFIDGAHDYESVKRDILTWKARLRNGGLMCGHDRNEPGVRQAIDELCPGWKPAAEMIWYWTGWPRKMSADEMKKWAEGEMASGIRKMSVEDLVLDGTPHYFPAIAAATPPRPQLPSVAIDEWKQIGGTEQVRKIGLARMIPAISRNGDGTPRFTPADWGIGLALQAPLANCHSLILSIKDMDRGPCRTALVKQARSYGAKWGFFQDDDVVPPPDVLQKLQYVLENEDDDVAVCGGIYTTKSDPAVPLVFQDYGIGPFWRWKKGQVFEVQAIATGCMMIRLSIFDTLPEPWFVDVHGVEQARELGLLEDGGAQALSVQWTDDMYFCWKLRKHGLRMMAHGGVICDHWGQDGKCYKLADDSYPIKP